MYATLPNSPAWKFPKRKCPTGIEPTFSILPLYNVMREDEVKPGVSHEEAMKNAPAVHNDGFKVPRVIE